MVSAVKMRNLEIKLFYEVVYKNDFNRKRDLKYSNKEKAHKF